MKNSKLIVLASILAVTLVAPLLASAQGNPGQQLIDAIAAVSKYAMILLIGTGVLFLVFAGFMFIFARGDEGKLGTARSMLIWSVVGIAVGALAPAIINFAWGIIGKWW